MRKRGGRGFGNVKPGIFLLRITFTADIAEQCERKNTTVPLFYLRALVLEVGKAPETRYEVLLYLRCQMKGADDDARTV